MVKLFLLESWQCISVFCKLNVWCTVICKQFIRTVVDSCRYICHMCTLANRSRASADIHVTRVQLADRSRASADIHVTCAHWRTDHVHLQTYMLHVHTSGQITCICRHTCYMCTLADRSRASADIHVTCAHWRTDHVHLQTYMLHVHTSGQITCICRHTCYMCTLADRSRASADIHVCTDSHSDCRQFQIHIASFNQVYKWIAISISRLQCMDFTLKFNL